MDSFLFLLSLIAMVVIAAWAVTNDKVPPDGRTHGFLAMKRPLAPGEQEPDKTNPQASRGARGGKASRRRDRAGLDEGPEVQEQDDLMEQAPAEGKRWISKGEALRRRKAGR